MASKYCVGQKHPQQSKIDGSIYYPVCLVLHTLYALTIFVSLYHFYFQYYEKEAISHLLFLKNLFFLLWSVIIDVCFKKGLYNTPMENDIL